MAWDNVGWEPPSARWSRMERDAVAKGGSLGGHDPLHPSLMHVGALDLLGRARRRHGRRREQKQRERRGQGSKTKKEVLFPGMPARTRATPHLACRRHRRPVVQPRLHEVCVAPLVLPPARLTRVSRVVAAVKPLAPVLALSKRGPILLQWCRQLAARRPTSRQLWRSTRLCITRSSSARGDSPLAGI